MLNFLVLQIKRLRKKYGISGGLDYDSAFPSVGDQAYFFSNDSEGNPSFHSSDSFDSCPNDPHKLGFRNKGLRDLSSYMAGQSHYNHNTGKWENESLIRSITEEVIRRLKGW